MNYPKKICQNAGVVISLLLILYIQTGCAQSVQQSQSFQYQTFLSQPELKHAAAGLIIMDADTKQTIASYNSEKSLSPASVQKLVTTAYALEKLGSSYRFQTKIYYSGSIDTITQILNGNIYVKAGGDPSLGSKYFHKNRAVEEDITQAVRELGIKKVNGNIIVDDNIYDTQRAASSWAWQDIANYYASGASGFTYKDNLYALYFDTRGKVGSKTKLIKQVPKVPGMTFINEVVSYAGRSDLSYIYGSEYSNLRYVRGELPAGRKAYKIKGAVPNPPLYFAQTLKLALENKAIKVNGQALHERNVDFKNAKELLVIRSPQLSAIITKTNTHSINLYAEHLLRQPLTVIHKQVSAKAAADDMKAYWTAQAVNCEGVEYADGCGLAILGKLTPVHLAELLYFMRNSSSVSDAFYRSLPVAGKSGTLKYFLDNTSAADKFRLKSGSFTGVRSYAGYGTTQSGRHIIAVVMVNNYTGKSSAMKNQMEKLFLSIYTDVK
ncbi:MAG: D-alanyl-D-alanine carboxypeptidase/D-alanyl-D-alanine-endopeptidase [Bacteroidota bacterium]|nr:D-alanyl-D-alanine carboxypeptidase/D-alanyl-D-alanine-endopeptidase [Bacteroidota bacterium]